MIEMDIEFLEALSNFSSVEIYEFFRSFLFLFRSEENRHPVFIGAADVNNFLAAESFIPGVDIRREVGPRNVTDVKRTICIG